MAAPARATIRFVSKPLSLRLTPRSRSSPLSASGGCKTRPEEMDLGAEAHGVEVPTTKKTPYSIDDNLWGRAIECGILEDPWNEPPEDIYTTDRFP